MQIRSAVDSSDRPRAPSPTEVLVVLDRILAVCRVFLMDKATPAEASFHYTIIRRTPAQISVRLFDFRDICGYTDAIHRVLWCTTSNKKKLRQMLTDIAQRRIVRCS